MAILTYPLNGILYDAEDVETYLCTRTSGVFSDDGHFPASVTGTREVTIGPGLAWMQNEEYHGKAIYNPENVSLEIAEADAYQTRIDRIVLQFDKLLNMTSLMVKQGTPSSNPQPPAIERTSLIYELGLYTVTVKNSTASVSEGDIESTMLDETVCGIMEDAVTSIPTQELYDQWHGWFEGIVADTEEFENQFNIWFQEIKDQAEEYMKENEQEWEDWRTDQQKDFDEWFDNLQYVLDGDVAGHLQNGIDEAQDTADEAMEQLASGYVRGYLTDEAEGGEYALLAEDDDESYAITLSRPICNCDGNGNTNDIIADSFSQSHNYAAGDYCIYGNILYYFTSAKAGGAWDSSKVRATTVANELSAIYNSATFNISTLRNEVEEAQTSVNTLRTEIQTTAADVLTLRSDLTEQQATVEALQEAVEEYIAMNNEENVGPGPVTPDDGDDGDDDGSDDDGNNTGTLEPGEIIPDDTTGETPDDDTDN